MTSQNLARGMAMVFNAKTVLKTVFCAKALPFKPIEDFGFSRQYSVASPEYPRNQETPP